MYRITIDYTTGDSFNTYDYSKLLDGSWADLNIVGVNLERIKQHYEWYQEENRHYRRSPKKVLKRPDFTHPKYDTSLNLLLDNGTEYLVSAFWCGYFETLHSASVSLDMKVEF